MRAEGAKEFESITVEWPTLALIGMTYVSLGVLTWFGNQLQWWVLVPAGGYLTCLYGSLQHEALHGHPTRHSRINEALVFIPFQVWFPYRRYKKLHLQHHRDDLLTDPHADPETYYMDAADWHDASSPLRLLLKINNTLLGRLVIGPFIAIARFASSEGKALVRGDRHVQEAWVLHAIGLFALWMWVDIICGMDIWRYLLLIVYPGICLTALRTFAEHRAHEKASCRTLIVESNPLLSLVFLNNNLHAAHHERPSLPWYDLPGYYRQHKSRLTEQNCGYVLKGYHKLFSTYLLQAKEPVAHPLRERIKE